MKQPAVTPFKTGLTIFCMILSAAGFMIKLPAAFRHYDKELHTVFYFLAAAFLNVLFAGTRFIRHLLTAAFLFTAGMAIELAQEYSNRFFHSRIHGDFDREDVVANTKGLLLFSIVWIVVVLIRWLMKKENTPDRDIENSTFFL